MGLLLVRTVFTVKTMVWVSGLFAALALYLLCRRGFALSRSLALLAATLYYTLPCITSLNGTTSSDQMNLFFEVLTLILMW